MMEDERRLLRRIALYDYWTNNPKQNNNQPDFRRHFISNSGWMPSTHQISDFMIKTMNQNFETSCNLMAGKRPSDFRTSQNNPRE